MKRHPECYPCALRQALNLARHHGANNDEQMQLMHDAMMVLVDAELTPQQPRLASNMHDLLRQRFPGTDPYRALKDQSTTKALALYPRLKEIVSQSADPCDTAVRLAIAGNIIDYGPADAYDLEASVDRVLHQALAIDHIARLQDALGRASWVLFLGDNAGETVFDRVLVEEMTLPVTYVVKGSPVINDATREDAVAAGLEPLVRLVDNGTDVAGTVLPRCSDEFLSLFRSAEVIVAKGMGNYETLSTEGPRLFFLLQSKCEPVSRDLGVPVGSLVVKQG